MLLFTLGCHAYRICHVCHDMEKLGSIETKGKKRETTKKSTSGRAQGTLAPHQNVLSDHSALSSVGQPSLILSLPPQPPLLPHQLPESPEKQSNLIIHTFSRKNFPVESNPLYHRLMKVLYQISIY